MFGGIGEKSVPVHSVFGDIGEKSVPVHNVFGHIDFKKCITSYVFLDLSFAILVTVAPKIWKVKDASGNSARKIKDGRVNPL